MLEQKTGNERGREENEQMVVREPNVRKKKHELKMEENEEMEVG